jgi:hypothetical protein
MGASCPDARAGVASDAAMHGITLSRILLIFDLLPEDDRPDLRAASGFAMKMPRNGRRGWTDSRIDHVQRWARLAVMKFQWI